MIKRYRDYSKTEYSYYSLCEDCNSKVNAGSRFCKQCFQKGERNSRFKGGHKRKDGYIILSIDGKKILEHRYIWEKHNGKIPKGYDVHHKNEIKDDNRPENLELIRKTYHRSLRHIKNKKGLIRECSDCKSKLELTKNFPPRKNKLGIIAGYRGRCNKCWRNHIAQKMRKWRNKNVQDK